MSGPSKQSHNAGQTVVVQQISPMPVKDVDWGPITITENWGRLFIRWDGQEIIALMGHYPKLVEAIQHFIEPTIRTPDPAQIRADALREAAALIHRIADGYAAGGDNAIACGLYLTEGNVLALIATPLSPTAVDGSIAPDAGGKEGV